MSHVVNLGAGATVAALPNGDLYGKQAPVMNNFFQTAGLNKILEKLHIKTASNNLEEIYSDYYDKNNNSQEIKELNKAIFNYFASFEIPDEPTIYDFLVLGLKPNDLIATFNWDPLLVQAYIRCSEFTDRLPQLAFLHGNVAIGYCEDCLNYGSINGKCSKCGKTFSPMQLLFPIKNKNYTENKIISAFWQETQNYIKEATMITVFGYGAPSTDTEAIKLFKDAWGDLDNRQLEEFQFINIEDEESCLNKWKQFVHSHHYRYSKDFFDSYIAMFPRRSDLVEILIHNFNLYHRPDKGYKKNMT